MANSRPVLYFLKLCTYIVLDIIQGNSCFIWSLAVKYYLVVNISTRVPSEGFLSVMAVTLSHSDISCT